MDCHTKPSPSAQEQQQHQQQQQHNHNTIASSSSSTKTKKSKKEKKRKSRSDDSSNNNKQHDEDVNYSKRSTVKKDKKSKKSKALFHNRDDGDEDGRPTQPRKNDDPSQKEEVEVVTSSLTSKSIHSNNDAMVGTPKIMSNRMFIFSSIVAPSDKNSTTPSSSSHSLKKSPYQIKTIQGSVALLPSSLPNVPKCIQSLLTSLLLMYDSKMGGVLLCIEDNVQVLPLLESKNNNIPSCDDSGGNNINNNHANKSDSRGRIVVVGGKMIDDLPYIHYNFQARVLLFCPKVGMKLKGQVIECTSTYITLTTHHILTTKIWTEKLHEQGFYYNEMSMEWTREREVGTRIDGEEEHNHTDNIRMGPSTSIYLDDIVEFVVDRILECGGYITLGGIRPSVSTS